MEVPKRSDVKSMVATCDWTGTLNGKPCGQRISAGRTHCCVGHPIANPVLAYVVAPGERGAPPVVCPGADVDFEGLFEVIYNGPISEDTVEGAHLKFRPGEDTEHPHDALLACFECQNGHHQDCLDPQEMTRGGIWEPEVVKCCCDP